MSPPGNTELAANAPLNYPIVPPKRSTFGIGASDIAAIAGLSKYSSPWDVFKRLTSTSIDELQQQIEGDELGADLVAGDAELEQDDRDMYSRAGWGHRLEPAIRQAYCDETGLTVRLVGSLFASSDGRPWARATPDGIACEPQHAGPATHTIVADLDRLVQIKNVGQFLAQEWADAPPDYVQLQEQWELYVTGLQRADVAALIGGGEFRIFTIWRDDKMIEDLVSIAEDFWNRVQRGQSPDVDGSAACRAMIGRRLAAVKPIELVADDSAEALTTEYKQHYLAEYSAVTGKKLTANQLLERLAGAGATKLVTSHGTIGTRRVPEKVVASTDWKSVARELGDRFGVTEAQLAALIAEHTGTTTKASSISLIAPRSWSALKKGTSE